MPKVLPVERDGVLIGHMVFCPVCQCGHLFDDGRWKYNGNTDRPSFTPSMLIKCNTPDLKGHNPEARSSVCHSFVTDGKISYCNDSTHALSGQEVDLPDFDEMHKEGGA